MSPTLKSTVVRHFGVKFEEKYVGRCESNFNLIWEKHAAVVCKRNHVDIFCRLSIMHERDRQTDRSQNERRHQIGDVA